MATKKPLVLYAGSMQELGAADRLDYVKLGGDSMTGDLAIGKASPTLILNKAASGQSATLRGSMGGTARWDVVLGDSGAESSPASGSHYRIIRYNNAGAAQDGANGAFAIARDNGDAYIYNRLNVTTIRLGNAYSGGTGSVGFTMTADLSAANNAIVGENNASRRWLLELGNVGSQNLVISRWSGASSLLSIPFTIEWATGWFSTNGAWNHTGSMAADAFYWQGANTGLVPQGGTWQTDGTHRINTIWNVTGGQGDTNYAAAYHQPGVVSFWQLNQAGVFMRYRNDGHLLVQAAYDVYSDVRTKFDIEPIDNVRERIEAAPVRTFRKSTEIPIIAGPTHPSAAPRRIGVLAQELEIHTPEAVTIHATDDYPDLRSVDASALGALALAGVQDLYSRLDAALSRIHELEQQLKPASTA